MTIGLLLENRPNFRAIFKVFNFFEIEKKNSFKTKKYYFGDIHKIQVLCNFRKEMLKIASSIQNRPNFRAIFKVFNFFEIFFQKSRKAFWRIGEADLNPKFRVRISKIAASRLRTDWQTNKQTNKQTDKLTGTHMGKFTILKLQLAPMVREED